MKIKMEEVERKLLKKAYVLIIISLIGILVVVRGEILGEKAVLYAFGGAIGMLSAIFVGLICFFILGLKAGIKVKND